MLSILLRVRLLSLFQATLGGGKKRRSLPAILLLGLLFLFAVGYIVLSLTAVFALVLFPLIEVGALHVFFALGCALCLLALLFGGVVLTKNQLYSADDNEMLLAMPIPPRTILLSRVLLLMILNYLIELVVALPMLLAYLLLGAPQPQLLLPLAVTLLALPFLAQAITALLGYLLARLEARIKRKSLVTLILSLLFLGVYFFFIFSLEKFTASETLDLAPLISLADNLLPLAWLGGAAMGAPLPLISLLCLTAGLAVAVLAWLSRTFQSTAIDGGGSASVVYREKRRAGHSPLVALVLRELQLLASSSGYMMNAGLGLLFLFVPSIYILVDPSTLATLTRLTGSAALAAPLLATGMLVISSMVLFSCHTVSLEGRTLWIVRTSPVPTRTVLLSKVLFQAVLALPCALVSGVLLSVAAGLDFPTGAAFVLLLLVHNLFLSILGLVCNLLLPKLEWKNMMVPIKQGLSTLLTMLGGAILSLLVGGVATVLSFLLSPSLALLLAALLSLALGGGLFAYLWHGGVRRFESL